LANHASALKRVRQSQKRRMRNKMRKTRIKNLIKAVEAAIREKAVDKAQENLKRAQSYIDKIGRKRGTLHRKNASRKVSRLSKKVHDLVKAAQS